ncbi:UDP-glucose 4-epimerase [Paenochrobactrum gallinarii]|uniref:UDP-glucose 4-epimerase n=1 Tax=Paenochrobactrum gallinarii TaxID=643673 RepID=A0A841M6G4_9HYPH|nr:NAD-dependent epimerase/dehydratase family protein [Paenochrobactrum gallinarii]MBB6261728.1 UDP-glucose 4-epimerase [Paenochrobactrum gallinarii]
MSDVKQKTPRVLVTGATGFIGRALVPFLQSRGYHVKATSRSRHADMAQLPEPDADIKTFEKLVEDCVHVIHLAAIAHVMHELPAETYDKANRLLTEKLAQAAKNKIAGKFVFISSIGVQTGSVREGILTESDDNKPERDYGRAKLLAEDAIHAVYGQDKRFTILRPVLVYGKGAGGNLARLVKLAKLPLPLPFANQTQKRNLLDREALCDAIAHVLATSVTDGETYLVADQSAVTIADIISSLRQGMGRKPMLVPFPHKLLELAANLAGQQKALQALTGPLMVSSQKLAQTGWHAPRDTKARLQKMTKD